MNKTLKIFWCTLCFIFITILPAYNQFETTPVEKSGQKIQYLGNTYYVHTVKAGHTLFSICKAYNVSQEDIANANPDAIINPLSVGLVLKIPVIEETVSSSDETAPFLSENRSDNNFYYHTVQPKETLYYLHQKYNIPVELIHKYNPGIENAIQIGQVLKIPKKHLAEAIENQPDIPVENMIRYPVKQGDTLYRIAQTYGVSIGEIINANEELRWGLKTGQIINIPVIPGITGIPVDTVSSVFLVSSRSRLSPYQCDSIATTDRMRPPVKIALLLPFYTKENFSQEESPATDSLSEPGMIKTKPLKGRVAAELYEGFLLALDSLKKTNHSISLFVYDTEADTTVTRNILSDLDIIEPDLIIGPLAPDNITIVSKYSFERKIPYVPPLIVDEIVVKTNPYLFKTIPPDELLYRQYAKYLVNHIQGNIILLSKNNLKQNNETAYFKNILSQQLNHKNSSDSAVIIEVYIDDLLQANLGNVLLPDTLNNVIVFSNYEPDVIFALSQLHFLLRDLSIKVYGFPAWQKFDNLRIDVVHELEVTLYSPFYIDYNENLVKSFIKKCREELHSEPYKTTSKGNGINYTFLGYDLAMLYIQSLYNYNDNMCDCIGYYTQALLLSDYHFKRNHPQEGFVNSSASLVTFQKNYDVVKIRTIQSE